MDEKNIFGAGITKTTPDSMVGAKADMKTNKAAKTTAKAAANTAAKAAANTAANIAGRSLTRRSFLIGSVVAGASVLTGASLVGCNGASTSTKAKDNQLAYEAGDENYYLFTDSAGRQVALPKQISKIAPSGSYAQIILASLCPEMLSNLSGSMSTTQLKYQNSCLADLPVLGKYYGKNGNLNYEELIKLSPDVIIDLGERKENIKDDMDGLQEQTGLPVIFIQATLDVVAEAYRKLAVVCGCTERANTIADYIDGVINFAAEHREEIAAVSPRVAYCGGPYGYAIKEAGGVHAAPLEMIGLNNVCTLESVNSTEASPEQMMLWDPEVVLLSESDGFFDYIYDDKTWAPISAVKNKRVYEVPGQPYEWLDKPPSVQTVLGTLWLGNLLYPEIYQFDMAKKVEEFFKLFWGYDMSDEEAQSFLVNSTALAHA